MHCFRIAPVAVLIFCATAAWGETCSNRQEIGEVPSKANEKKIYIWFSDHKGDLTCEGERNWNLNPQHILELAQNTKSAMEQLRLHGNNDKTFRNISMQHGVRISSDEKTLQACIWDIPNQDFKNDIWTAKVTIQISQPGLNLTSKDFTPSIFARLVAAMLLVRWKEGASSKFGLFFGWENKKDYGSKLGSISFEGLWYKFRNFTSIHDSTGTLTETREHYNYPSSCSRIKDFS